jgi:H+/Cl- antiporter ClcA
MIGGLLTAGFLGSLNWAGTVRNDNEWLIYLLPLGGLVVGLLYHQFGQPIAGGTSLVLDAVHVPDGEVPSRMAPMIYTGSVTSHVVGASVGREGAAVQMVASVTDDIARRLRLPRASRRVLLVAAIAAAFGGLFGVPIAGALFALETQRRTRAHAVALLPALTASVVANDIARRVGANHEHIEAVTGVSFSWNIMWRVVATAACCAVVAIAYIQIEHRIRDLFARWVKYPPLRPAVGGMLVLLLTALAGTRVYLGISTDLMYGALTGAAGIAAAAFAWKLIFTATSLGTGFVGGEMFPLFIIGALTGAQFARVTDASVPLFAALGLIAVFAAASNTPVTCIVIGIELFGWGGLGAYVPVVLIAVALSGDHTIYKPSPLAKTHLDTA